MMETIHSSDFMVIIMGLIHW